MTELSRQFTIQLHIQPRYIEAKADLVAELHELLEEYRSSGVIEAYDIES